MKKIRVLYDISILGRGQYCSRSRAGIYQVIKQTSERLAADKNVEVKFSASQAGLSVDEYLTGPESVVPKSRFTQSIDGNKRRALSKFLFKDNSHGSYGARLNGSSGIVSTLKNILYGADIKYSEFINYRLSDRAVRWADIYHSSFYPIPEYIMNESTVKKIITVYDIIPLIHPEYFSGNEKRMLMTVVDQIRTGDVTALCISESTKEDLLKYLGSKENAKIKSFPLGASDLCGRDEDKDGSDVVLRKHKLQPDHYILCVGTLEPRKNLTRVLKSFDIFVKLNKSSGLKLAIVGASGWKTGSFYSVYSQLPKNTRDKVVMLGYVEDEDLPHLYRNARFFLYPSLYEGFGLPALEAMTCGTPVITSNRSSLPEICGDAAIKVNPESNAEIASAMLRMHIDHDLRTSLSALSVKQAKKFNWNDGIRTVINAYNSLAQEECSGV